MSLGLRGKHTNDTIIQCLQQRISTMVIIVNCKAETEMTPRDNVLFIVGNLNVKVGNGNTDFDKVIGKHGSGTKNVNGGRLVENCVMYKLIIGTTLFTSRNS